MLHTNQPVPCVTPTDKSTPAGHFDLTQPTLLLPPDFVSPFPPRFQAEMVALKGGWLRLEIVDPLSKAKGKRYTITRHHGSYRISVPRWWLRDRRAKPSDTVELSLDAASSTTAYLTLRPHTGDPSDAVSR